MDRKIERSITIKITFLSSHQESVNWSWVRYLIEMMKLVIQKSHVKNKVTIIDGERIVK